MTYNIVVLLKAYILSLTFTNLPLFSDYLYCFGTSPRLVDPKAATKGPVPDTKGPMPDVENCLLMSFSNMSEA